MGCDFGVYTHFYQEREQTARKSHKCGECGQEIKPGEKYVKIIGKYNNDFVETKQCLECNAIYHWADDAGFCAGHGTLWEDIWDGWDSGIDDEYVPGTGDGFEAFKRRFAGKSPTGMEPLPELALRKLYEVVEYWEESARLARERRLKNARQA